MKTPVLRAHRSLTRKTEAAYKQLAMRYYDRLTEQVGNGKRACIAEHARALHVSVVSLTRACRSALGATPTKAARSIAMNWAFRRLREGATPVEVCLGAGYEEYHNFAKQFRREHGISPSLVKKNR